MIADNSSEPNRLNLWLEPLDLPQTAPDTLGREVFVRSLSDAIAKLPNDRSMVTAVYGPWGSGKSWLREKIVEFLEKDHPASVNVCSFAPWELNSNEQILEEFFKAVSLKIPKEDDFKDVSTLWERLGQLTIAGSMGIGATATAWQIGDGLAAPTSFGLAFQSFMLSFGNLFLAAGKSRGEPDKKTLIETKEEISQELLERLSRPILVVIDDLDRLTDTEIRLMVKLINTTANLPRLHYLIFGDRLQIAKALDPICGNQGDRYLEKMVQNSFQVPEPGENQIRLRLWSGVETIARNNGEEIGSHGKRFSLYWDYFLKHRICNYRDCHRLLRALDFHAGALTREGALEADLVDLLGVEFLRVFDPVVYQKIAAETPTQSWCHANLSGVDKDKDATRALDFLDESQLDQKTICGAIVSLFPHLGERIKNHLEQNQLGLIRYINRSEQYSSRNGINSDRSSIYFELNLSATDLPEAQVRLFLSISNDSVHMHRVMEEFHSKGWLSQLMSLLVSNPKSIRNGNHAIEILTSLSLISDELKDSKEPEFDELSCAASLSKQLMQLALKDGLQQEFIHAMTGSTHDVTLGLSLIEQLRDASDCKFTSGAKAPYEMPKLGIEEIEKISDEILPRVVDRFWKNTFMKSRNEAWRAYRMAHALGPARTEKVLEKAMVNEASSEKIWYLIEAIAISIMPSMRLDSWDQEELKNAKDSVLLDHLLQFASSVFWKAFLLGEIPPSTGNTNSIDLIFDALVATERVPKPPSELSKQLVEHLELPLREKGKDE